MVLDGLVSQLIYYRLQHGAQELLSTVVKDVVEIWRSGVSYVLVKTRTPRSVRPDLQPISVNIFIFYLSSVVGIGVYDCRRGIAWIGALCVDIQGRCFLRS